MQATLVISRNPFNPGLDRSVCTLRRKRRVSTLAPKTSQPFICLLNGEPLLRARWKKTNVRDGDILNFVTLPQGGGGGEGGGKNPLATIAMLALVVYAPQLAASLGSSMGVTSAVGLGMVKMGIMVAGSMLINALLPPPRPPSPQQAAAMAAPSPTYSLGAQGNSARIGSAIPVQYGRHICHPDFAAQPYAEFAGNEQYLYQLFCVGQGSYDVEAVRLEDTPTSSFEEITYEVVAPGGAVTLFPSNVVTSVEVAGAEALPNVYLGPFVATASGVQSNFIAIDVVCPKGLYYANDDGTFARRQVSFQVEAQLIDANGAPQGGWGLLSTPEMGSTYDIAAASNTPQRVSVRYSVALGRYQVRLRRTDTKDTSPRAGHDLNWAGLRAFIPGSQSYGNLTMLAMRMKAGNNLSQAASRKVNVIATRKLPVWNGSSWSAPTATRSIAWALADACRNTDYGAKLADTQIDLAQLLALDAIWSARGDTLDGRFDNSMVFWEAITQIARAGRAKAYIQSGLLHVVRDQAQTVPVAMFSPRNTVRGSLKIDYLMPTAETADAVAVSYFDSTTWQPAEVTASLPGSTEANPARVQLFGVTSRAQAWREGMYVAACNRYRRKPISLTTEMEGFIPSYGDLVSVVSERLTAAQFGEVTGWDAGTRTLTVSEPLSWGVGTHYFGLRKRDGSFSGPWAATAGANAYLAVLATVPDFTPYTGSAEERTHYSFGTATEYRQLARLHSARPRGHLVELALINEYIDGNGDQYVHIADTGTPPAALAAWQLPKLFANPATPSGIVISETLINIQGIVRTRMDVSWAFDPAAEGYRVAWRVGTGNWIQLPDVGTTHASLIDSPVATVEVRVVAFAGTRLSLPASASAVLLGKTALPASVTSLTLDGNKLTWPAVADLDLAGYRVKYQYGINLEWGTANPLHAGLLTDSPYTMLITPPGQVTIMVRAVDTTGNESLTSAYVITNFGNSLVANVVESNDFKATTWPGSIANATVVGGNLQATQSDPFYGADDSNFYDLDGTLFYSANYDAMEWISTGWTPSLAAAGSNMTVAWTLTGDAMAVQYRPTGPGSFYGTDLATFYGNDADQFYAAPPDWQTWPGTIVAVNQEYQWRVATAVGGNSGLLSAFTVSVDVPDKDMKLNGIALGSGGSRLTGAIGAFNVIQNIQLTLQGGSTPPRQNSCRLFRTKNPGAAMKDKNWHDTDKHSRTGR